MWTSERVLTLVARAKPGDCVTEARLAELSGLSAAAIRRSCLRLRKHGLLERAGRGCHKLTAAGRAAVEQGAKLRSGGKGRKRTGVRRKSESLRARSWLAIRRLGKFTIDDVLMLAVQGGETAARTNLSDYFVALERAGYLAALPVREEPSGPGSNGCKRWRLAADTGRQAPVLRRDKRIYDPNLERHVKADGSESVCG